MSSVRTAFLQGKLRNFLPYGPEDLPALLNRPRAAPREALSQALLAYLRRIGAPEESLRQAERLAHPESRVIVTGQQAGLLTGPSYTFYKAHTALCLARTHDREDRPVLAVFWVASQDHDTEEVASAHLLGFDERLTALTLELPPRRPVGRLPFAPHYPRVKAFLEGFGGVGSVRRAVLEALEGGWSYAEAFARLLLRFLGGRGLVVLDPMSPEIAPLFRAVYERELDDPLASSLAINAAGEALRAQGFEPALGRGRGATNLFIESEAGERRLLRYEDGVFADGERTYTKAELRELVRHAPERITPAAGLRPVAQDALLPTAGFVVGPGEMGYVAQLGGVYRLHGLEMPAVIDRMHGVVLEPPTRRLLEKYSLSPWEFMENPEEALLRALAERNEAARRVEAGLRRIEEEFARTLAALPRLDPTLEGALRRGRERLEHELERMRQKVLQAELRKGRVLRAQFDRMLVHLRPLGQPQERVLPFLNYMLKHGTGVLDRLLCSPARGRVVLEV